MATCTTPTSVPFRAQYQDAFEQLYGIVLRAPDDHPNYPAEFAHDLVKALHGHVQRRDNSKMPTGSSDFAPEPQYVKQFANFLRSYPEQHNGEKFAMVTLCNFIELYSVAHGFHKEYFRASDWPDVRLVDLYIVVRFLYRRANSCGLVSSASAAGVEMVMLIDRLATGNRRCVALARALENATVGVVTKMHDGTLSSPAAADQTIADFVKVLHHAQNVHNHRCLHPMHKRVIAGTHAGDSVMVLEHGEKTLGSGHMVIPFSLRHGTTDSMQHNMLPNDDVAKCRTLLHRALVHEFVGRVDQRVTSSGDGKTAENVSAARDFSASASKSEAMLRFYGRVARALAAESDHKAFSPLVLTGHAKSAFDEMFEVLAVNASAAGVSPGEMQQAKHMVQRLMAQGDGDPDFVVVRGASPLVVMAYAANLHACAYGLVGMTPAWRMLAQLFMVVGRCGSIWPADMAPMTKLPCNTAANALRSQIENCCLLRPVHNLDVAVTEAYRSGRGQGGPLSGYPIVLGTQKTSPSGESSILEVIWDAARKNNVDADIVTSACVAGITYGAAFCATMYAAPESGPRDLLVAVSHLDHALFSLCGLLGESSDANAQYVKRKAQHEIPPVYAQAVLLELVRVSLIMSWAVSGSTSSKKPSLGVCLREALRTGRLTIFDAFRLGHALVEPPFGQAWSADVILHYGVGDRVYASLFDALSSENAKPADTWALLQREAHALFYEYLGVLQERCTQALVGEPGADAFEYAVLFHTLVMAAKMAESKHASLGFGGVASCPTLQSMIGHSEQFMRDPQLAEMHQNQKLRVMDVRFALQRSGAFSALPFAVTLNYDTAFVGGGNSGGGANSNTGLKAARTVFVSSHASQMVALLMLESRLWSIAQGSLGHCTVTSRFGDTLLPITGAAEASYCVGRVSCTNGPVCLGSPTDGTRSSQNARHHHDLGSMVHEFRSRGAGAASVAPPHDLHAALYDPSPTFADPTVATTQQYHEHDAGCLHPFTTTAGHSESNIDKFGRTYIPSVVNPVYDAMRLVSAVHGLAVPQTEQVFSATPQKHAGQLTPDIRSVLCRIHARDVEAINAAHAAQLAECSSSDDDSSSDDEDSCERPKAVKKRCVAYPSQPFNKWSSSGRSPVHLASLLHAHPAHLSLFESTHRLTSAAYRQRDASYTMFNAWLYKAFGFEVSVQNTTARADGVMAGVADFGDTMAPIQGATKDVVLIPESFIGKYLVIVLPNQVMEMLSPMIPTDSDKELFVRAHVFHRTTPPSCNRSGVSGSLVEPPLFLVDGLGNVVSSTELVRVGVIPRVDNLLQMLFVGRGVIPGFAAMPTGLVAAVAMEQVDDDAGASECVF